ncbi:hypothetical protein, conserved [Eimeria praecox]|uniref:Uncharacterized protein n=1 Tax=Eimeria praecox TaxID=51316 RepID=U6H040_9EIME|nr:hypothetical protein, conserved [Eimeria praecox]
MIIEAALTTSVQSEASHQRDELASVEDCQILRNTAEPSKEEPRLERQQKVQQRSKHPDVHRLNIPSQLLSIQESPVTENGASCDQQQEQNPLMQKGEKCEQLHHGDDYDAYLVDLLSAEARDASASGASRQLQAQLGLATQQPSVCDKQDELSAVTHQETLQTVVVGEQKALSSGTLPVGEPGASLSRVRTNVEDTTSASSLAGQAAATGLPTATTQLQWIREALILLRRIDDPQHVQLQRRKKAAVAAGACAASPTPTQPAGNTFLPEDTADASAAAGVCSSAFKCLVSPPSKSSRLLYVMWIGAGGGPWGGRSNTWFYHRRQLLEGVAAAHADAASKMIVGGVELRPFLRAVEALAAAERSLTETCFGAPVARQVLLRRSFGKVMLLRPTLQQLLRDDDWSGKRPTCMA